MKESTYDYRKCFEVVANHAIWLDDDFQEVDDKDDTSKIIFLLPHVVDSPIGWASFDAFIDGFCIGMGYEPVYDRWVNYIPEDHLFILYLSQGSRRCKGSTISTVERHADFLADLHPRIEAMIFDIENDEDMPTQEDSK